MSEEGLQAQVNTYLLGELPPAQAAAFERALSSDDALRNLLREREKELEQMALKITQVEPPDAVRERILAAAAADLPTSASPAVRYTPPATAVGWSAFFWRSLAAGVAVLTVGAGLWTWRDRARREDDALRAQVRELTVENGALRDAREESATVREVRSQLEREVATLRAQIETSGQNNAALREQLARAERALLAAQNQNVFTRLQVGSLQPPAESSPDNPASKPRVAAKGFAMWDPQRQEGMLVAENLPLLRPDQDYQVWVADSARPQPVPSGVFHPARAGGQETLRFVTNEHIERATQFMVTLERKGGVNRITGPAVLASLPRR